MQDLIDKYFENTLSDTEKLDFEENLRTEPIFKEAFEFQKSMRAAIHLKERRELKGLLKDIDSRNRSRMTTTKGGKYWYYAAAAAVIGFIAIFFYNQQQGTDAALYMAYHEVYPNVVAPNVRGENAEDLKSKALLAYESEDYQKALTLFSQIKDDEYPVFYTALCYLELDLPAKTVEILATARFSDSPYPFETYRKWYLALAYLKLENSKAAKEQLQILTKTPNIQARKAAELLEKL